MDVLFSIVNDFIFFFVLLDFLMQLNNLLTFWGHSHALSTISILAVVVDFQGVEYLFFLIILFSQLIQLLFVLAHSAQKLSIRLLTGQELVDHFLNIAIASGRSYFLESILKGSVLLHLILHLFLQKLTPQFLHLEICPCSNLSLIPVLIGRRFSNLLLLLNTIDSFLESFLLILNTVLQSYDSLVTLLLLVLYVHHQVVEAVPGLQLLLLGNSLLLEFLFIYLILAPK